MKNKFLIVDDDMDSTEIQQIMAQKMGYYTKIAINGYDAIMTIKQDPPDIILMDIFMPGMDGYETIKYLESFNIPIVVITGGGEEVIKNITELGILFYVEKPIFFDEYWKVINKCFDYYEIY